MGTSWRPIGLATICRPTEAIMLFIPLLWATQNTESKKRKWQLVKENYQHIYWALAFGFIGILPQLIYWKIATDSFVHNVGSKWYFLNPFFRVIFGFENGWMVYTPITIFFVLGFFFIKKFPFKKSVITFCLLNIWIVISWSDWKYGATYSTRALVQSYPIFALAFTAIVEIISRKRWKIPFLILGGYLIFVNIFQLEQYYNTVLHYRDMNKQYYSRIYLNSSPTPLDMSLLDTDEVLDSEKGYSTYKKAAIESEILINGITNYSTMLIGFKQSDNLTENTDKERWIKVNSTIKINQGFSNSSLICKLQSDTSSKEKKIRLFSPISKNGMANEYEFYVKVPGSFTQFDVNLFLYTHSTLYCSIEKLEIAYLTK